LAGKNIVVQYGDNYTSQCKYYEWMEKSDVRGEIMEMTDGLGSH
jgi:hypothetical protein